ncbi:MAG TPA: hypothetical protein VGT08_14130 [Terracidiphilus sp.]|nr:hypothetical protein [Terracidiphilus sp.]
MRVTLLPHRPWYYLLMTTVEIFYRYTTPPTESITFALASTRDVYGVRRISIDADARTLRVEFDATRLNAATVTKLIRLTGLEIAEELPLIPPPPQPTLAA